MLSILCKDMQQQLRKYDYGEVVNRFDKFYNTFKPLTELNTGDKLGYDNEDNIYIDKQSMIQGFQRWYYNQKRGEVFGRFESQIKEYVLFIRYVDQVYTNTIRVQDVTLLRALCLRIDSLTKILIESMSYLLITYKNDESICKLLNNLKSTLDYRNRQLQDINV